MNQGLDINYLVVLSGAHTLGYARCAIFRGRIYNDSYIDPTFENSLRSFCPPLPSNVSDPRLAALDQTPSVFDTSYYKNLLQRKGLLHSDQVLLSDPHAVELVKFCSEDGKRFQRDFAKSMVKMGNKAFDR